MGRIIHVEQFEHRLNLPDLRNLLFEHFGCKTGNAGKIKIEGLTGSTIVVRYDELLEHDDLVTKLKISPATTPSAER